MSIASQVPHVLIAAAGTAAAGFVLSRLRSSGANAGRARLGLPDVVLAVVLVSLFSAVASILAYQARIGLTTINPFSMSALLGGLSWLSSLTRTRTDAKFTAMLIGLSALFAALAVGGSWLVSPTAERPATPVGLMVSGALVAGLEVAVLLGLRHALPGSESTVDPVS